MKIVLAYSGGLDTSVILRWLKERLKLYKGNIIVAGCKSTKRLYDPRVATMEGGAGDAYDQSDATGFIRLQALRLKVRALSSP